MIGFGDMLNLIHLYSDRDQDFFYNWEEESFYKAVGGSHERIDAADLPLGTRRKAEVSSVAVVHRGGYSSMVPLLGVPRIHYCFDVERGEYLLKVLPPVQQGHSRQDSHADFFVVLPEAAMPEDALEKSARLAKIQQDIEEGVLYRELLGYF